MPISGKRKDLWMWIEILTCQSDGIWAILLPGWNVCFLLIFARMLLVSDFIFSLQTPSADLPLPLAAAEFVKPLLHLAR